MISYISEGIKFNLKNKAGLKKWLTDVINSYKKKVGDISFIFVNDEYLLDVNIKYLNHNYYTDIITFDNSELNKISGDLLISIDRVKENAEIYNVNFDNELYRVMVHGILHLLGFSDDTDEKRSKMKDLEDYFLQKLNF